MKPDPTCHNTEDFALVSLLEWIKVSETVSLVTASISGPMVFQWKLIVTAVKISVHLINWARPDNAV